MTPRSEPNIELFALIKPGSWQQNLLRSGIAPQFPGFKVEKKKKIKCFGLTEFGADQFHKTTDALHHISNHSHSIMISTVRKHTRAQSIMSN